MKKVLFILIATIAYNTISFAQDVITKRNGTDIISKVLEVTATEVKYKAIDNLEGPTFTALKSEILMIRYSNGSKDVFEEEKLQTTVEPKINMCNKGKEDSRVFYRGQGSGSGWTIATTILLSPVIGVIPAAISSSSEPSMEKLNYPDSDLMRNSEYSNCYIEQATKKKKSKIWSSFGVSSAIWLGLILLL